MLFPFPHEINTIIFDELKEIQAEGTLASCALVCRSWLPFARQSLYRTLDHLSPTGIYRCMDGQKVAETDERFGWLRGLVESLQSPDIGPLVLGFRADRLRKFGTYDARLDDVAEDIKTLLPYLPNCRKIRIEAMTHRYAFNVIRAACGGLAPLTRLELNFSPRFRFGFSHIPSLINLPRFLYRNNKLDNLRALKILVLENYCAFNCNEIRWNSGAPEYKEGYSLVEAGPKEFRPLPTWLLVSLKMTNFMVPNPELPFIVGDVGGLKRELEYLYLHHGQRRHQSLNDLLSFITTHAPSTGLRSLAIDQTAFTDDPDYHTKQMNNIHSTVMQEIVERCPNLVTLHLEGLLYVGDSFLVQSIPSKLRKLRIVPFDRVVFEVYDNDQLISYQFEEIFPHRRFSPAKWCEFLAESSSRVGVSSSLCQLEIGRSCWWTSQDVEYIRKAAGENRQGLILEIVKPLLSPSCWSDRSGGDLFTLEIPLLQVTSNPEKACRDAELDGRPVPLCWE